MPTVLVAVSDRDFDPTESAVPWRVMSDAGVDVRFTTPDGRPGKCDPLVLTGPLFGMLGAKPEHVELYRRMEADPAFRSPVAYGDVDPSAYDGLVLVGGHAKGMRTYLEAEALRERIRAFWDDQKAIGAICHGVVALARTTEPKTGRSIVAGRTVTSLPRWMERSAWLMTAWKLGDYYRTYPEWVQDEVTRLVGPEGRFERGPLSNDYRRPHVVRDGRLVTARWPGDADAFAKAFLGVLGEQRVAAK